MTSTVFNPKVEIELGSVWTDITPYVYYRDSIQVSGGQPDETSQVQAGTCRFTLNNNDGRFSPRKPTGAYYGQIGRNTPVRVSIPTTASYAWLPGLNDLTYGVQTPDSAQLSVTGDIDIRMEVQLENWHVDNNNIHSIPQQVDLAGKVDLTGNQRSWYWTLIPTGGLRFVWSSDGTSSTGGFFGSSVPVPVPGDGRLALRVTLKVNNGLGGWTVTFYTSDSINGTWTQLDQFVSTTTGATSIFDSTAPVRIGNISSIDYATFGFQPAFGKLFAFQMLNGIGGTVVANPDFTSLVEGTTSFTDSHSNTWTMSGQVEVLQREFRFIGEVSSWPATWDTGGFDVYVPIVANGIMRRLGQGTRPLQSSLRTRIVAFSPLAYWPMEDGSASTQAASALANGAPMVTSGLTFASDDTLAGSAPLPSINAGATLLAHVPRPTGSPSTIYTEIAYRIPSAPASTATLIQYTTSGTAATWSFNYQTSGNVEILATDNSGATIVDVTATPGTAIVYGKWVRQRLTLTQSGSNVNWNVTWAVVGSTAASISSGSYAGTVGYAASVSSPPGGYSSALAGSTIGQIGFFTQVSNLAYDFADDGFINEPAAQRMVRLGTEENIQVSSFGVYSNEENMGPQSRETFLSLCQEAADADGGILYERKTLTGLGYRDRDTMYNQAAALTVSYTNSAVIAPLQPTGDDFLIRNDVTVTRTNGSSSTQIDSTSALSVNPPPAGVGDYSTEYTLNLYNDARLGLIAGWKLHLGTWDEERYPVVNLALHNDTSLVPSVLAMNVGDRVTITNPPSWLAPQSIDLLVIGYSETFDQFTWFLQLVCVPYGPWNIAIADDATYARAGTNGSVLAASATSGATSLTVETTDGPLWTTSAGDFPLNVNVGGELVTASTIASSALDTFTRTVSNGWGSADTGQAWTTTGNAASDFNVGSGAGHQIHTTVGLRRQSTFTAPSADIDVKVRFQVDKLPLTDSNYAFLGARYTDVNNCYFARVQLVPSTNVMTLSIRKRVTGTETELANFTIDQFFTTGTYYWIRFSVIGSRLRAKAWMDSVPELDWMLDQTDTSLTSTGSVMVWSLLGASTTDTLPVTFTMDSLEVLNPQTFTVTRSVNGIVKAQTAGTSVSLSTPSYTAL